MSTQPRHIPQRSGNQDPQTVSRRSSTLHAINISERAVRHAFVHTRVSSMHQSDSEARAVRIATEYAHQHKILNMYIQGIRTHVHITRLMLVSSASGQRLETETLHRPERVANCHKVLGTHLLPRKAAYTLSQICDKVSAEHVLDINRVLCTDNTSHTTQRSCASLAQPP